MKIKFNIALTKLAAGGWSWSLFPKGITQINGINSSAVYPTKREARAKAEAYRNWFEGREIHDLEKAAPTRGTLGVFLWDESLGRVGHNGKWRRLTTDECKDLATEFIKGSRESGDK